MSLKPQPNPHDTESPTGNASPFRVLVVEDNQDLAKLFCDLLEVIGCITDMAFNVRAALESVRRTRPDLLFCDLRLPGGKSGFDLATEMRSDPALAHIPLIAVTGYHDIEEQQRAMAAGFDCIFEKPIKFAQILEVLNRYRKQ